MPIVCAFGILGAGFQRANCQTAQDEPERRATREMRVDNNVGMTDAVVRERCAEAE